MWIYGQPISITHSIGSTVDLIQSEDIDFLSLSVVFEQETLIAWMTYFNMSYASGLEVKSLLAGSEKTLGKTSTQLGNYSGAGKTPLYTRQAE